MKVKQQVVGDKSLRNYIFKLWYIKHEFIVIIRFHNYVKNYMILRDFLLSLALKSRLKKKS